MAEYILKEEARKAIRSVYDKTAIMTDYSQVSDTYSLMERTMIEADTRIKTVRDCMKAIETVHGADTDALAKELNRLLGRKNGRWFIYELGMFKTFRCSECDRMAEKRTAYCPYCGAQMFHVHKRSNE